MILLYDMGMVDGRKSGLYRCLCGREKVVRHDLINREIIRSCGCRINSKLRTHGMGKTIEHKTWRSMLLRTTCKSSPMYKKYGARGIGVSDSWKNSFENFFRDMGPRPNGYSIDRIDNTVGYSADNCRWANSKTQQNSVIFNNFQ